MNLKRKPRDLSSGPVVKTTPLTAGGVGSIPGQGTKVPHSSRPKNPVKQKQQYNKCNKDLKKIKRSSHQKKKEIPSVNLCIHDCHSSTESKERHLSQVHAKSLQSCLTVCNPIDYSLPGCSVHGILQVRILKWIAIFFLQEFFFL